MELAEELNPSEELPVLIKLGQGCFEAPETEWEISFKWIYFAGNGSENTRIVADKIEINSEAITSFKDIYIDSVLDIGDNFVQVDNIKVLQLEKKEGKLEGVWQNAIGKLQISESLPTTPFNKERLNFPLDFNPNVLKKDGEGNLIMVESDPPTSNLKLWLKADSITGLANNDPVNLWTDQSGNNNNANQNTETYKPTYIENSINGKPVVRFNNTFLDILGSGNITDPEDMTILGSTEILGGDAIFLPKIYRSILTEN